MKVPNHVLRGIREGERRQSREEFARDIVRAGEESEDPRDRVACDARLVARWEDGDVLSPRPVYRRLLSKVTGRLFEDLGFASQHKQTPTENADATDADFSASLRVSIDSAASLWGDDIGRRKFLVDAAFTGALFAGPVLRWLTTGDAESVGSTAAGRPVTARDVAAVRATTETFRRLDNLYGGGHVRSAVVGYLHGEVAPLLKEGRYSESAGKLLFGAAAELTHLAGWMAYDIERHGLAQRYLVQALRFAMAAGDRGFGGEVLAGMSHQAVYLDQPQQAVDLARAARQTADRAAIPALVAESAAMEAHALAELGDKRAAVRALDQAERAYERDTGTDRPAWLRYLDEAYLGVVTSRVVDAGDGWLAAEGGVAAVVVVGVEPGGEGCGAVG